MTTGSCLCGGVRWEMHGPYDTMRHCHCSMCRKAHASAYATFVGTKKAQFQWTGGADLIRDYEGSDGFIRSFCSRCGSSLPIHKVSPSHNFVPAGGTSHDLDMQPQEHIFVASKAPWETIGGDLPQHDAYPASIPRGSVDRELVPPRDDGKLQGSCLCGEAVYLVTPPFAVVHQCHCTRCQQARAAAFTVNGFVPAEQFEYVKGADLIDRYKLPEAARFGQSFCRKCGSGMPPAGLTEGMVGVPFGTLDHDPGCGPIDHIFVDYKQPWDEITDDLPQLPEGPG